MPLLQGAREWWPRAFWRGSFCRRLSLSLIHTSKGTFLSRAAPEPERMASSKACRASAVLLGGPELDLDTGRDAMGAWVARRGRGGGAGGPSKPGGSDPCADSAAWRRLWSSSEAEDVTFRRLQVPLCPRMAASRAERSLSPSM